MRERGRGGWPGARGEERKRGEGRKEKKKKKRVKEKGKIGKINEEKENEEKEKRERKRIGGGARQRRPRPWSATCGVVTRVRATGDGARNHEGREEKEGARFAAAGRDASRWMGKRWDGN